MKTESDPEDLEALWKSPENWKAGSIYYCKADPRVIVPKRQKWMGWTINFARASAFPTLIGLVAFISLPLVWLAFHGLANTWIWFAVLAADIVAVCLICWVMAAPKRR